MIKAQLTNVTAEGGFLRRSLQSPRAESCRCSHRAQGLSSIETVLLFSPAYKVFPCMPNWAAESAVHIQGEPEREVKPPQSDAQDEKPAVSQSW